MEKSRLIAYNTLKSNIIDNFYCTACGACEAACPTNALKVENESVTRVFDCSQVLDLCPICYEVCPHSPALLLRSLEPLSDAPVRSEAVGYFRKILLAQSNDPKCREQTHDGAVVTTLLTNGLNDKTFDSAVVTQTEDANPIKPKSSVAIFQEEIVKSIGSKFFPSSVIKAYGDAVLNYNKNNIAVVGVPCQVLALRKIDAWQHKISGKSKLIIGLFCFGTFSAVPFLNYLAREYKIPASEIEKIHLSKELMIETKKGIIGIPISELKSNILPSCKTCIDYTAEVSDISVGSGYPLKDWSVVIIRTKKGEDCFNAAVKKGIINTRDIDWEPEVFERVIVAALQKRTMGLIEESKLEKSHSFVPVRFIRETEALATVKVEDIMTKEISTIPSSMTISNLLKIMATSTHTGYPVIEANGELSGIVTIEEVSTVDKASRWSTTVGDIKRKNVAVCYPGETALDAFRKMSDLETGRIIVLDPANPKKMLGIVSKRDIMHAMVQQAAKAEPI
ncbi:MAG: Coenzyme F420 hydrogenase/dehydrogenase, beta subunit C-terminal domain [Candidatus Bathyarchaeia archaeon]